MALYGDGTSFGTPTLAENKLTKRARTKVALRMDLLTGTPLVDQIVPCAAVKILVE